MKELHSKGLSNMAKLINALFSNSAHGRLGGLIYEVGKFGQYVKAHVPQHKKPTAAQLQQNLFFGNAADAWRLLSDVQKAEYNTRAVPLQITGFNLYIKENIEKP